ncbi:hypothetical protein Tco_1096380, partial [Tanacetum coccineum]
LPGRLVAGDNIPGRLVAGDNIPGRLVAGDNIPGRLVAGDNIPGRHVTRDMLQGKARQGYFSGRLSRATWWGPHSFSQSVKCHSGYLFQATCRPGK